jgi:hypothetical protein
LRQDVAPAEASSYDASATRGELSHTASPHHEQSRKRVNGLGVLAKGDDANAWVCIADLRERNSATEVRVGHCAKSREETVQSVRVSVDGIAHRAKLCLRSFAQLRNKLGKCELYSVTLT